LEIGDNKNYPREVALNITHDDTVFSIFFIIPLIRIAPWMRQDDYESSIAQSVFHNKKEPGYSSRSFLFSLIYRPIFISRLYDKMETINERTIKTQSLLSQKTMNMSTLLNK